jgi:hypothetical protein
VVAISFSSGCTGAGVGVGGGVGTGATAAAAEAVTMGAGVVMVAGEAVVEDILLLLLFFFLRCLVVDLLICDDELDMILKRVVEFVRIPRMFVHFFYYTRT